MDRSACGCFIIDSDASNEQLINGVDHRLSQIRSIVVLSTNDRVRVKDDDLDEAIIQNISWLAGDCETLMEAIAKRLGGGNG